jgi:hypothetical protein
MGCPRFAPGRKAVKRCASNHYRMGAEGNGFDDIGATSETAVDDHGESLTHGVYDFRQHIYRRYTAIELSAAVIGDDDAVTTQIGCVSRISRIQYAFDDEFARP